MSLQLPELPDEIKKIENKVNDTLKDVVIPIGDGDNKYSVTINVKLTLTGIATGGKSTRRRQKK